MSDQPSLFDTPKETGYPIIMQGKWEDFVAVALVDTPEEKDKLLNLGYIESEE